MIEFTVSRAALMICGTILLSAIGIPMSQMFDSDGADMLQSVADADAASIDAFWASNLDVMYIDGSDMLPSPGYSLTVNGHHLTVTDTNGNTRTAMLAHSAENMSIGYGDTLSAVRAGETLSFQTFPRSS